jgi:ABC-2 type transport system ATP-binding protein
MRHDEFDDCMEMARALLGGYEGAGDLWEANDHVNRALRCRPLEPEAWILKSQILSSLDDDLAALAASEMAVKRLINRVSVDAAFFKKLSPMENLLFAARLYGLDGKTAKREAIVILARLGISEKRIDRPVEQMSRGMQQKVAIARALLTSPTLLLLDEPTTGLDPRSKLDVQAFIEEVNEAHDATIVLTTHDLAEAERLCTRITILDGGRVVAEDTPEGLKRLVAEVHGQEPTLQAVFMTYTGRSLDEDVEEDGADTD